MRKPDTYEVELIGYILLGLYGATSLYWYRKGKAAAPVSPSEPDSR